MPFMNVTQQVNASIQYGAVVPAPIMPAIAYEDVAVSASSAKSAEFNDATRLVTVSSDVAIRIVVGTHATVDAAGEAGTYLPAGTVFSFVPQSEGLAVAAVTA